MMKTDPINHLSYWNPEQLPVVTVGGPKKKERKKSPSGIVIHSVKRVYPLFGQIGEQCCETAHALVAMPERCFVND